MSEYRRVVLEPRVVGDQLPEWASHGVLLLEWLRQQGRWEEAADLLKVQREGGYAGVDALVFLLYYFGSGLRVGVKEFSDRAREQQVRLAAVGGRRRLPTQSSMSRLLAAVDSDMARSFGDWLLRQAPGLVSILHHPSVLTRDAVGKGWHIFDWDPTVTTLRHRALPELEGTPDAKRRSEAMAAPGYPGRKRGEVQFSRATLQHAGSGLWLGIELAPGNGALREAFHGAIEQVVSTCDYAALGRERAVLRADGVAGNVPFTTACAEAGVHYITRLAHYQLLQARDIVSHLNEATWFEVPSSGSGPTRHACDLGRVQLEPAPETTRVNGKAYDPIEVRVIVSRFPSQTETGRGAGVVVDGWQYELYGTDLDPDGWPEAEIVASYYRRTGQENRFHQEDRELGLDRIFSYHLPGLQLATLIGLFVWNFQICRGMELANPPRDVAEQPPTEVSPACDGAVLPKAPAAESAPVEKDILPFIPTNDELPQIPWSSEATGGTSTANEDRVGATDEPSSNLPASRKQAQSVYVATSRHDVIEAMDALDWKTILKHHPGWDWSAPHGGLQCPGNVTLPLVRIEHVKGKKVRSRFMAPSGACRSCAFREGCIRSDDPNYQKDVRLPLPTTHADLLREMWLSLRCPWGKTSASGRSVAERPPSTRFVWRRKPPDWKPPQLPPERSPFAVLPPLLLPAELRKLTRKATRGVDVRVRVNLAPVHVHHPTLALSTAERQQRRLSWSERLRWNALPAGSAVELVFSGGTDIAKLLDCSPSGPDRANTA